MTSARKIRATGRTGNAISQQPANYPGPIIRTHYLRDDEWPGVAFLVAGRRNEN